MSPAFLLALSMAFCLAEIYVKNVIKKGEYLTSVSLDKSPVDGIGKRKLFQIGQDVILNFVGREFRTLLEDIF
jgi:hypothetical protein